MSNYPKKMNALCVGVLSGDRVLFQGPADTVNGGFKQKILHLTGISSPKIDHIKGTEQPYAYASREYLRTRLVGQTLDFIIERKVNQIEVGYIMHEGSDISIELLENGLARLRGEKINCDNFEDYKEAEDFAKKDKQGMWELPAGKQAKRYLSKSDSESEIFKQLKDQEQTALVEELQPSRALVYIQKEGLLFHLNYSDIQVVVLSQKINGQNKSNIKSVRSSIESLFLNRQVKIKITDYKEGLFGYLTYQKEDVRKVLLRNGFAKLGKDAMGNIPTKDFLQLKKQAEAALKEGKGLWKDQKIEKTQGPVSSKSFNGTVVEVHSGDSLSVLHPTKNEAVRVFFPNSRAPSLSQPLGFEAKELLRKRAIGQDVRVDIEFSKRINVKRDDGKQEVKDLTFATVIFNNTILATLLLEAGLLQIQTPRVEEDITKHFETLRQAQNKGKAAKRGLFSNKQQRVHNFNDLSGSKQKKIDATKCKNMFAHLKDDKKHPAVIEIVLNASRFKVRFSKEHILAIMVLEGVRGLPNQGAFKTYSERGLNYSKMNILQRDVEVQLKRVDNKGIFHGAIYFNKKDYSTELLQNGLAITLPGRNQQEKYRESEAKARKEKQGLWAAQLDLSELKGEVSQKAYKKISKEIQGYVNEVPYANQIYIEPKGVKRPDLPEKPSPIGAIKIGDICLGKFTKDDVWYRARIIKESPKNHYLVHYIDFGNYETLSKDRMGAISEDLKKVEPGVIRVSLYGVAASKEALPILRDFLDAEVTVQLLEQSQDGQQFRGIITEKEESVNLEVLRYGGGDCTVTRQEFVKAEDQAKQNLAGKWDREDDEY